MAAPLAWSTWRNAWQAAQKGAEINNRTGARKATVGSGHGEMNLPQPVAFHGGKEC